MNFSNKLSFAILITGMMVLILLSFVVYRFSYDSIMESQFIYTQSITDEISDDIDQLLHEKVKTALTLASTPIIKTSLVTSNLSYSLLSAEEREASIARLNEKWKSTEDSTDTFILNFTDNRVSRFLKDQQALLKGEYGEIFLTNKFGALIASTSKLSTYAHGHKYWWLGSYSNGEGAVFFDDRGYDDSVGGYVLGLVVPIRNGTEIIGILKCNLNILGSVSKLISGAKDKLLGTFKLARSGGMVVFEEGSEPLSTRVHDSISEKLRSKDHEAFIVDDAGETYLVGVSEIELTKGEEGYGFGGTFESIDHKKGNTGESWYIICYRPMGLVIAPVTGSTKSVILIGTAVILVLVLISQLFGRKIEMTLSKSEDKYRSLVETTSDWIWEVDQNGVYTYSSPKIKDLLGYAPQEVIGKTPFELMPADEAERVGGLFRNVIASRKSFESMENTSLHKDGRPVMLETSGVPIFDKTGDLIGYRGIDRDITDRRKLEDALLKTAKLESLGTLSGGIAHDFNNMLSIILGYLSLIEGGLQLSSESSQYLQEAEDACVRAKDLTARLITFSEGGDPVKRVMSIGAFVRESVKSALDGSDTNCEILAAEDLFPVEIDDGQMKQVINNIVVNAHEAMDGKGVVRVYCENVTISDKDALHLEEGKYVKISITDQGVGISEENLGKIFDPYFSTKERGAEKGMGLGLSVCHSIVEKHNGLITVESELGAGTTLYLYLPASEKVITEPKSLEEDLPKESISGSGKLLVMDDEEMIRKLAINRLSQLGYDVEVAKDGTESIELYRNAMNSGNPFDVVILDLTIQMGMGGKEAIQKLHEIDPDVKGIVATGYSADPVVTDYREYGFKGALTKPYTTYELSKILHDVISER